MNSRRPDSTVTACRFQLHDLVGGNTHRPRRRCSSGSNSRSSLFFVGQLGLISSLVNFVALTAFLLLHVAVISYSGVRRRSRNIVLHRVVPIIGFCIIGFVLWNAEPAAKIGGIVWLVVGIGVLMYYTCRGIGVLPEHRADSDVQLKI